MEKILGDVLTWPWFSEPHGYNFNGLLIPAPDGNICIDPVEPNEEVMSELVARGVSRILLTNRNHLRAANRIRERTGARTYIPKTPRTQSRRVARSTVNFTRVKRLARSKL